MIPLPLKKGEIHLWVCRDECIIRPYLIAEYIAVLSDGERQQMAQFPFARHRHQYLVTRVLVRHVLSMYRPDVDARHWRFAYNNHGKPRIHPLQDPSQSLHFNLSHTDGLVVMAVSRQIIGIDAENLSSKSDIVTDVATFFSAAERSDLQQCGTSQRIERSFEIWTLKEAYLKARGEGLSVPLDSFAFRLGPCPEHPLRFIPPASDPLPWQFWSTCLQNRYYLAIATACETTQDKFNLSVQDIVPRIHTFNRLCLCWRQTAHDVPMPP